MAEGVRKDSGSWQAKVSWYADQPDGTRKRRYQSKRFSTQRKAIEWRRERLSELAAEGPASDEMTVDELSRRWLAEQRKIGRATSTIQSNERVLRGYFADLMSEDVGDVSKSMVQMALDDLVESGGERRKELAATTIQRAHAVLRGVFGYGVELGVIRINPAQGVTRPTVKATTPEAWSLTETAAMMRWLETGGRGKTVHRWADVFWLITSTGLRLGEVLALQWSAINLDDKTLTVDSAYSRADGRDGTPKTELSVRTLGLDDETIRRLKRHRERQEENAAKTDVPPPCFVVAKPDGERPSYDTLSQAWERVVERAQKDGVAVSDIPLKGLRATHATLVGRQPGATSRDVADRLGHSSTVTAQRFYVASSTARGGELAKGVADDLAQAERKLREAAGEEMPKRRPPPHLDPDHPDFEF